MKKEHDELFAQVMESDPMKLVEMGSESAKVLVAHIVKGYRTGIPDAYMAKAVYEKIVEDDDGTNAVLLLSCLMSMARALYETHIADDRVKVSKTN